jgi:hypothetical protein
MYKKAEEWLFSEDKGCFVKRAGRLEWLISKAPPAKIWTFPGGWLGKQLFEEARYCFVYGQFLATVVLGFAYVERTLNAEFYGAGRNDMQRATSEILLQEAYEEGLLNEEELKAFDKARRLRNVMVHFRKPMHIKSPEFRAIESECDPYTIIEDDAKHILEVAFRLLARNAVGQ